MFSTICFMFMDHCALVTVVLGFLSHRVLSSTASSTKSVFDFVKNPEFKFLKIPKCKNGTGPPPTRLSLLNFPSSKHKSDDKFTQCMIQDDNIVLVRTPEYNRVSIFRNSLQMIVFLLIQLSISKHRIM